jgi:signal transduction histidine kinase
MSIRYCSFIFLFGFLLLSGLGVNAQFKTDSLRKLLRAHSEQDSLKVVLLLSLGNEYEMVNSDSIFDYGRQALGLSQKLQFNKGIANAYELIGAAYTMKGNYDSALVYFHKALSIAKDNKLGKLIATKYNHIANAHFLKAAYAEASIYYDSVIIAADQNGNAEIKGSTNSNLANVYFKMGDYTRALQYYLAGLKIQEQLGSEINIASDLANIANVYYRLGAYDKAIDYTDRAMAYHKKSGIKEHMIGSLTTYAMIYSDKKQYDSSLYYLYEALQLAHEMKSPYLENILKGNMAEAWLKKGDFNKAELLYEESLRMSVQLGDVEGIAIAKAGIGETALKQNDIVKGRKYLGEALVMMLELGIKEQAMTIAAKLSSSYEQSGDFKNAFYFRKVHDSLSDDLNKEKAGQEAEQLMFGYEIQKKEDKIKLLEKDNAIIESKNRNQQVLTITFLVGLLLMGAIAYLLYRNARNERRNRLLIEEQAHRLSELNDFKDTTFSLLAHDLRSPINSLASAIILLDEELMSPEEFMRFRQELSDRFQSVSMLLDNMLYWAQSQMKGESTIEIERLHVKRKVLRVISVLYPSALQKNISIVNNIPENIWVVGDRNHVEIIIRNIISNAIKYTHESGKIVLFATRDEHSVNITVSDTGVGMTEEKVRQLFANNIQRSTKGTVGEKGTGLGLFLCYELVKRNNGDIKVISTPGKGSVFTIMLPAG